MLFIKHPLTANYYTVSLVHSIKELSVYNQGISSCRNSTYALQNQSDLYIIYGISTAINGFRSISSWSLSQLGISPLMISASSSYNGLDWFYYFSVGKAFTQNTPYINGTYSLVRGASLGTIVVGRNMNTRGSMIIDLQVGRIANNSGTWTTPYHVYGYYTTITYIFETGGYKSGFYIGISNQNNNILTQYMSSYSNNDYITITFYNFPYRIYQNSAVVTTKIQTNVYSSKKG